MKDWLKKQATELTAWIGAFLIVGAFFLPRSAFIIIGIILIATDDKKASAWISEKAPWAQKKIDESFK